MTGMFFPMVLFGFARVVFGVRIPGMAGFLGVGAAFSPMTASFGSLIAGLGTMVMPGSAWVPRFVFPAWLQKVTVVIPTRRAVDAIPVALRAIPVMTAPIGLRIAGLRETRSHLRLGSADVRLSGAAANGDRGGSDPLGGGRASRPPPRFLSRCRASRPPRRFPSRCSWGVPWCAAPWP